MSSANLASPQKPIRHKKRVETAPQTSSFVVTEDEALKGRLSGEELCAVRAYRNVLTEFASNQTLEIEKIAVAFSEDRDSPDEIVFAIYVFAPADAALTFWDRVGEAQEEWLQTQSETMKEFIYERFVTAVRWK